MRHCCAQKTKSTPEKPTTYHPRTMPQWLLVCVLAVLPARAHVCKPLVQLDVDAYVGRWYQVSVLVLLVQTMN